MIYLTQYLTWVPSFSKRTGELFDYLINTDGQSCRLTFRTRQSQKNVITRELKQPELNHINLNQNKNVPQTKKE